MTTSVYSGSFLGMDELARRILKLIQGDLDPTASLIEGESGVIGFESGNELFFVTITDA